jgi:hypothetical protein
MLRHFALGDDAELVVVHELDRLFDRDDMPRVGDVDVIDEGGQRGGFSAAGRAGDEVSPLWKRVSNLRLSGNPSSSMERTLVLIMRKTMSIPRRCLTTLVRKRPKSVA